MWFKYFSHIRAANDQASLHIRTVSPEPLEITLKRRDVDEGLGQLVWANSRKFGTNRICEQRIPKKECMWMKAQAKILGSVHEKYHIC